MSATVLRTRPAHHKVEFAKPIAIWKDKRACFNVSFSAACVRACACRQSQSTIARREALMNMSDDERLHYVRRLTMIQLLPASVINSDTKQVDGSKRKE